MFCSLETKHLSLNPDCRGSFTFRLCSQVMVASVLILKDLVGMFCTAVLTSVSYGGHFLSPQPSRFVLECTAGYAVTR